MTFWRKHLINNLLSHDATGENLAVKRCNWCCRSYARLSLRRNTHGPLAKMTISPNTILLLITQPRSSSEYKLGYFWCIPRAPIDSKDPYMIKVQKCRKEIGQIIHVTSALILRSYENTFCVQKKTKNNEFIQQFVSSVTHSHHFGEYPLNVNNVCYSVSTASCLYVVYVQIKAQTTYTMYPRDTRAV